MNQIILSDGQILDVFPNLLRQFLNDARLINPFTNDLFSPADEIIIKRFCSENINLLINFLNAVERHVASEPECIDFTLLADTYLSNKTVEVIFAHDLQVILDLLTNIRDPNYLYTLDYYDLMFFGDLAVQLFNALNWIVDRFAVNLVTEDIYLTQQINGNSTELTYCLDNQLESNKFYQFHVVLSGTTLYDKLTSPNFDLNANSIILEQFNYFLKLLKIEVSRKELLGKKINEQQLKTTFYPIDLVAEIVLRLLCKDLFPEAIAMGKKIIHKIDLLLDNESPHTDAQPIKKKQKHSRLPNHLAINFLRTKQVSLHKSIAFCQFRINQLPHAVVNSNLAMALINHSCVPGEAIAYKIFNLAIQTIYHVSVNDEETARNHLDRLFLVVKNKKVLDHIDMIIIASAKLAEAFFLLQKWPDSIYYYEQQRFYLMAYLQSRHKQANKNFKPSPLDLSTPDKIDNKIRFIKLRIQKDNASYLTQHLIETKSDLLIEGSCLYALKDSNYELTFELQEEEFAKFLLMEIYKREIPLLATSCESRSITFDPNGLSSDIIDQMFRHAQINYQHHITKLQFPDESHTSQLNASQESIPFFDETINSPRTNHKHPTKSVLSKTKNKIKLSTVSATLFAEHPLPDKITWAEDLYYEKNSPGNITLLPKSRYIEPGKWFAYLDRVTLSKYLPDHILNQAQDLIAKGGVSNTGPAIKLVTKQERGQSNFNYKLRFLGAHGRGDIRIYARTLQLRLGKEVYNLMVFDFPATHKTKIATVKRGFRF